MKLNNKLSNLNSIFCFLRQDAKNQVQNVDKIISSDRVHFNKHIVRQLWNKSLG